jgi:hypothetical protein
MGLWGNIKRAFNPPPRPPPPKQTQAQIDAAHNARIITEINRLRNLIKTENNNIDQYNRLLNKDKSDIQNYNRLIDDLNKQFRGPKPTNITPSAVKAQPPVITAQMLQHALSQVEYYKQKVLVAQSDILAFQKQIQTLSKSLFDAQSNDEAQNALIVKLKADLEKETALYNAANIQISNTFTAQKMAEFNKSVAETQGLLTDLNQPYVTRGDDIVAMLSKYIPKTNADATYKKIEYREEEYAKLKNINTIINIIYYLGVVFLFVLLHTSDNLFLKDRFVFYLFLLLFPFLYPWIYLYTIQLWTYLFPTKLFSGPTNAFIDQTEQPNVYYN